MQQKELNQESFSNQGDQMLIIGVLPEGVKMNPNATFEPVNESTINSSTN